jgi:CDP-glucose 4,6-dehydratase
MPELWRGPQADFWRGKRVLLTGHTGFKGSWLALWLHQLGASVTGLALPPESPNQLFVSADVASLIDHHEVDIRDLNAVADVLARCRPDIVLHLAAQALVRKSYREPLDTFSVNVMGTINLLEVCRTIEGIRSVVVVTSDKCYLNREWPWGYREDEPLGGEDPYSASKAATELVAHCWRSSFLHKSGVALATVRAGNVIGGGDWAEDRLVPDAVRAFLTGQPLTLRNPSATRPWQHVLEPLSGYLRVAEGLAEGESVDEAWNFGPDESSVRSVGEVATSMACVWGSGATVRLDDDQSAPHEAGFLSLTSAKARHRLGWRPQWTVDDALKRTISWYKESRNATVDDIRDMTLKQIADYQLALRGDDGVH